MTFEYIRFHRDVHAAVFIFPCYCAAAFKYHLVSQSCSEVVLFLVCNFFFTVNSLNDSNPGLPSINLKSERSLIIVKTVVTVNNFVLCPWCQKPKVKTRECQMCMCKPKVKTLVYQHRIHTPPPHFFELFYIYHSH